MNIIKRRIGKDMTIRWEILTNGKVVSLAGRDLRLELVNIEDRRMLNFTIDGNMIVASWLASEQKCTGTYSLTLWQNYGKSGQTVVDSSDYICLVRNSNQENDDTNGLDVETIDLTTGQMLAGVQGPKGDTFYPRMQGQYLSWVTEDGVQYSDPVFIGGKDAYMLAQDKGFDGTEDQWLESLKGDAPAAATEARLQAQRAKEAADAAEVIPGLITNAQSATEAANTAAGRVETAITNAQSATEATNTAIANAQSATEAATTAASNANTKANLANEKANLADAKATLANTAATSATTAANNANTKAGLADTAATNANNKATSAEQAASRANTAAENADTKAGEADTATDNANTAADRANIAAQAAELAISNMDRIYDGGNAFTEFGGSRTLDCGGA